MASGPRQVKVLTTGGTIEKSYSELDGSIANREPIFRKKLLSRLRLYYTDIAVHEIMAKDSLHMTDDDRDTICEAIKTYAVPGHPLVVLHGTDTLVKTIEHCSQNFQEPPVAIVFTGAMKPAGFDDSDAQQNFTEALLAAQFLEPGFYVSFHGSLFKPPHVQKNKDKATFEDPRFPL